MRPRAGVAEERPSAPGAVPQWSRTDGDPLIGHSWTPTGTPRKRGSEPSSPEPACLQPSVARAPHLPYTGAGGLGSGGLAGVARAPLPHRAPPVAAPDAAPARPTPLPPARRTPAPRRAGCTALARMPRGSTHRLAAARGRSPRRADPRGVVHLPGACGTPRLAARVG